MHKCFKGCDFENFSPCYTFLSWVHTIHVDVGVAGDEVPGPEPHRGRAAGHDQRGGHDQDQRSPHHHHPHQHDHTLNNERLSSTLSPRWTPTATARSTSPSSSPWWPGRWRTQTGEKTKKGKHKSTHSSIQTVDKKNIDRQTDGSDSVDKSLLA